MVMSIRSMRDCNKFFFSSVRSPNVVCCRDGLFLQPVYVRTYFTRNFRPYKIVKLRRADINDRYFEKKYKRDIFKDPQGVNERFGGGRSHRMIELLVSGGVNIWNSRYDFYDESDFLSEVEDIVYPSLVYRYFWGSMISIWWSIYIYPCIAFLITMFVLDFVFNFELIYYVGLFDYINLYLYNHERLDPFRRHCRKAYIPWHYYPRKFLWGVEHEWSSRYVFFRRGWP